VAISEWVEKAQLKLPALEAEFLQKSLEKRDRELKAELKQARQLKEVAEARAKAEKQRTQLAVGAGVVGVALVTFSGLLQVQLSKRGEANSLIASAQTLKNTNNQLETLMTSVKAINILEQVYIKKGDLLRQLQQIIYGVQERNRLEGHQAEVWGISMSQDGKFIASASADKKLKLWDEKGNLLKTFNEPNAKVWSVRFSHATNLFASTELDGYVRLWDANTRVMQDSFIAHEKSTYDISFSSDNKLMASSGRDGKIKIWSIENKKAKFIDELDAKKYLQRGGLTNEFRIYSVDIQPKNETKIAYAGDFDGSVRIWNRNSKNSPILLGKHKETFITLVRFSPDGDILASSGRDGTIKIWSTQEGKFGTLIGEINGHQKAVFGLAFSPDGQNLASASMDETIKIWQIDKVVESFKYSKNKKPFNKSSGILKGHTAMINRLEFSPDSQFIISSSDDQTVRIWEWQSSSNIQSHSQLIDYSCKALKNYLNTHANIAKEYQKICKF
jgi:WD40 repeat protein